MTLSRRSARQEKLNHAKYGYLFILPFFVVYLVFQAYPLMNTLYLAFHKYMITGANKVIGPQYIAFKNFSAVLSKGYMLRAFGNTWIMWIMNFIPQILLALLLAKWFTDPHLRIRGQGAVKIMVYMPNIITAASIAVLFYSLMAYPQGPFNAMLARLGVIDRAAYLNPGTTATVAVNFLESGKYTRAAIAFINFWMWYGNTMIIFIAGILGISPSLYEAAEVDGASGGQSFRFITLPLIRPIMLYTLVTSLIGGMQMYDIPALMLQQGSPAKAMTQTSMMYIMELIFDGTRDYGRGAAVSVLLFIVTGILSLTLFFLMRDRDSRKGGRA